MMQDSDQGTTTEKPPMEIHAANSMPCHNGIFCWGLRACLSKLYDCMDNTARKKGAK